MRAYFFVRNERESTLGVVCDVVPRAGEYVRIRGFPFMVKEVQWVVEDEDGSARLRANVIIEAAFHPEEEGVR